MLDALSSDVTAVAGEPFRIKIPFKGSPVPVATWYNVSGHFALSRLLCSIFCLTLCSIIEQPLFACHKSLVNTLLTRSMPELKPKHVQLLFKIC